MSSQYSYKELQQKIVQLEKQVSSLKTTQLSSDLDNNIFYKICEYSKNAIALFETQDKGKSFIIKYFNKKAEDLEHINKNDIIGKNISAAFPSTIKSGFIATLKNVYLTGIPEEFPAIITSDNKILEWKHNYIYKLSETEIVSIYIDISKEKIQSNELKKNRDKLRFAMQAAKYYWFEIDIPSAKITTQQEVYLSLGYTITELSDLLKNTGALIHHDDYANAFKLLTEEENRNKPDFNTEIRIKNAENQWVWFSTVGKVTKWDENNNSIQILGLIKNIQKEKEYKRKYKKSEEKFKSFTTLLPEVIYESDLQGNLSFVNLKAYETFEYTKEDFIKGLNIVQMLAPEDIPRAKENLKKIFANQTVTDNEYTALTKTGKRFPILIYHSIVKDDKKIVGLRGIIIDISEQKKLLSELITAKEKAEESDKIKSSFLANISHEIRTPMNGILGFTELLKDQGFTKKEKKEFFNIIDLNGKQLLSIIDNILNMSIIESGHVIIKKSQFKLNPLLKNIFLSFKKRQRNFNKENIKFKLNIPPSENPEIFTDTIRLQQIFNNLIDNAFKFTSSGSIEMGYSIQEINKSKMFQFYVLDTGEGIPEEMKDHIFDRFKQINSSKYLNKTGTGLGLAISKEFVKLLGGKIWINYSNKNTNTNKMIGTSFYFTIPIITGNN